MSESAPIGPDIRLFILDVMRYDFEQVSHICTLLNSRSSIGWRVFWPRDFTEDEVVSALGELLRGGLVEAFGEDIDRPELVPLPAPSTDPASLRTYWYRPTREGLGLWESWTPPIANEDDG